jgi:hypothetical protein
LSAPELIDLHETLSAMVKAWMELIFSENCSMVQSVLVTAAFDIPAYSTNGSNLAVTNLHTIIFAL